MLRTITWRRLGIIALVGLLLAGGATTAALAQGGDGGGDDTVEIASQDLSITDAVVRIGGAELAGPGLPDTHIEERTYTLQDATMNVDGLTVVWNDTTYEICNITLTVDDVGVTIHDLTLEDTG